MLDFLSVASEIIRDDPGLVPCQPAIEKELLHFEMLSAMHGAGHLRHLMFKGETCLRLCHGALRFSEDLDFSGGDAFDHRLLADIEGVLRDRIAGRYGLEVTVSPPKLADGKTRTTNRWIARVVTRPAATSRAVGVQRIKIEIDDNEPPSDIARLPIRSRISSTPRFDRQPVVPIRSRIHPRQPPAGSRVATRAVLGGCRICHGSGRSDSVLGRWGLGARRRAGEAFGGARVGSPTTARLPAESKLPHRVVIEMRDSTLGATSSARRQYAIARLATATP